MELLCVLPFVVVGALVSGAIGAALASGKNATGTGFLLGAFLGPIGWIIAGVMNGNPSPPQLYVTPTQWLPPGTPSNFIPCAWCRTLIDPLATVCARCLREQPRR